MIAPALIDPGYIQPANGCVVAAYAIVNNAFTGEPQGSAFDAYAEAMGWPERGPAAELAYAANRTWSGKLWELHQTSSVAYFRRARACFTGELREQGGMPGGIKETLFRLPALLVIGHKPIDRGEWHVIVVGAARGQLFVKDGTANRLHWFPNIRDILPHYERQEGLRYRYSDDSVLYTLS